MVYNPIYDRVKLALQELKKGNLIIVFDNEKRENEGDLIGLSEFVTSEKINFMMKEARGIITAPISSQISQKLNLPLMVPKERNTESFACAFTISVDAKNTTTGISASDRATSIKTLANPDSTFDSFHTPGHIFPLKAADGLLKERQGHTEASITLAKLANVTLATYICEILDEDGNPTKKDDLKKFALKHNLVYISIFDIIEYLENKRSSQKFIKTSLPTKQGNFEFMVNKSESMHVLIKGNILENNKDPLLLRIHSQCTTGDIFLSKRCDCGEQLQLSMKTIEQNKKGMVIYLKQEGRGINLFNKIKSYQLQEKNFDTYEANKYLGFDFDERNYHEVCLFLKKFNINKVKLITNNPLKIKALEEGGIEVLERIPIKTTVYEENKKYLKTKKNKMKHLLENI